jgi:EAL domain-containing protein (putative c-di-GMP-specific phosphodiesterase class I)
MSDPTAVGKAAARRTSYLLGSLARLGTLTAVLWIVLALAGSWTVCYLMGGSSTPFPHLFYAAIFLGALRFSWSGAVPVAVVAGLLVGPLMPAQVDTGTPQPLHAWLLRLSIFVAMGGFIAWISRGRADSIAADLLDAGTSSRLLTALRAGHVDVHYQPILDLDDHSVVAVEALARWTDPTEGPISPGSFIPAAERTGAIRALDRFVLEKTAARAARWSEEGRPALRVNVNVSAAWFVDDTLVETVRGVLGRTGLAAEQLELEITESALIADVPAAVRQLADLRALGVRIAIDDFGAGQSSFTYLADFRVDTVKVDRTLVSRVVGDPHAARLLSGLLRMFAALRLDVVVEGVESAEHYVQLQSLGSRLGQGFYLARPADEAATTRLLLMSRHPGGR